MVGGQCRNVGKTALIVDLIRAFPKCSWLAVKITPHHAGNSAVEHFHFGEERKGSSATDTARFLDAGASRAFLVRADRKHLASGLAALRPMFAEASCVAIESNAALDFLIPAFYLVVLDPRKADFKSSARRMLPCADAFVMRWPLRERPWPGVPERLLDPSRCFLQSFGHALPSGLRHLVARRMGLLGAE